MFPGMSLFTLIHVVVSLIAIATGVIVVGSLLVSKRVDGWTLGFLATTLATIVTGFLFPFHGFTPAIGLGILSTAVLLALVLARYAFRFAGSWRWIYAASVVVALYLNVFVLIAQSFQKISFLRNVAPTQSEPPFVVVQVLVLLLFVGLGAGAIRRFHSSASS